MDFKAPKLWKFPSGMVGWLAYELNRRLFSSDFAKHSEEIANLLLFNLKFSGLLMENVNMDDKMRCEK